MKSLRSLVLFLCLASSTHLASGDGLTVLTHGFGFGNGSQDWVKEMSEAIATRTATPGAPVILKLVVRAHVLPLTGNVVPYVESITNVQGPTLWGNQHNGEVILKIDWSDLDDVSPLTSAEEIGETVADYLVRQTVDGRLLVQQSIHLVGHSRGTAVNSGLARRLAELKIWVDHVTMLDPHPVEMFGDGQVRCWENIRFAENWYTTDWWPHGEFISGAQNCDLSDLIGVTIEGFCTPHELVHAYYHGTIQTGADDVDDCPIRDS